MRPEIACGSEERIPGVILGGRPGDHQNGNSNLFTLNRESLLGPDGYLNLSCVLRNAMIVSQAPDQALERLEYLLDTKAALGTLYSFCCEAQDATVACAIWAASRSMVPLNVGTPQC